MAGASSARPDWETDGRDWPNRSASRFVEAAGYRWHVQRAGTAAAPLMLLVHGTGAATHSFRDLLPLLAAHFDVVAFDLPGHGFTASLGGDDLSLAGMAASVGGLLTALEVAPAFALGHSAGTAILIQMALDGRIAPARLFGLNSALRPIEGNAFFSPMAKLLFLNPLVPRLFSWRARHGGVAGTLLSATGSSVDAAGQRHYTMLLEHPAHVAGALGMMARWDLVPLVERLPRLAVPLTLIVAEDDPMVPAEVSRRAAARAAQGEVVALTSGGHLLHEAEPALIVRLVLERTGAPAQRAQGDLR